MHDALIIGSGFGGLSTALELAAAGARVLLCETVKYPGGCASTFTHQGYRFEAGATLFSGFGAGQLFARWKERHDLDFEVDWLDPIVELRTPGFELAIPPRRDELLRRFLELPDAPARALLAFFEEQKRIADVIWSLLDRPDLLPPLSPRALVEHARRSPRYLRLLPHVGRPLSAMVERYGLAGFEPLRVYLDALCQITLQCSSREVEAPFALSTMDYYFRGTGHVRGGIGRLAWSLVEAIERRGGKVSFADRVRRLEPLEDGWRVVHRRGETRARTVVANLLPQNVRKLLPEDLGSTRRLQRTSERVESGWGACMLYRVAAPPSETSPPGANGKARHLELVQDTARPFTVGNHLFCSISGTADEDRAPAPLRTMTVSTHVPMAELLALPAEDQGEYIAGIQERMRRGLASLAPEWEEVAFEATASPRTFERFTGRHQGYVGGIPRRAGWHNYLGLSPRPVLPGLYLAGDSVFPGQSTLATALGGIQLARVIGSSRG